MFTGAYVGADLTLESVNLFPYVTGEWLTTETMTGTLIGSTVVGSYLYTECDFANDPASCPANGGCVVLADFAFDLP